MIQLFGLIFLIILISLIYLSYNGRISKNIPLIFMFFILVIIPFTYLETNKPNIENYSNYSNYDQIMNSSLDIYYTNQRKEIPIDNNILKKVKFIENPVQTKLINKNIDPITLYVYIIDYSPWYSLNIGDDVKITNIYNNYEGGLYIKTISLDDLINKTYNTKKTKRFIEIGLFKDEIASISNQTYIIISGNILTDFLSISQETQNLFINTYKFNWFNSLASSSGIGCFITILYKDNDAYILLQEKFGTDTGIAATQNFMTDITYAEQEGEIFTEESSNEIINDSKNNPLAKSKYNIIVPFNTKSFSALSFASENNKSFIFLSSRTIDNKYTLYSKSPVTEYGPISNTILDTQQPQYWVFEPINKVDSSPLVVFIRTYTKPSYYLEVSNDKIEMNMFKGSLNQYWEINGSKEDNYTIKHLKTESYIGYSNFGGYLYQDSGSVLLTKSNLYKWKITPNNEILPDIYEGFTQNIKNKYEGTESPTDFDTVENPSFRISKIINGKDIVIESKGRTVWEPSYSRTWNGKWIYYGTVASYEATQNINTTSFLIIKLNQNGNGTLEDQYFNFKIKLINAGSNILTGIINSGKFNGYRAILKMIPSNLKYYDASKSYPVKMRYYIETDQQKFNLSSGNIYNMNGYSTKFDGDKLILANFLEASGIQVDIDKAFTSADLQKINDSIIKQKELPPIFDKINSWLPKPITSNQLLYKASINGWSANIFHQFCDNKGSTITIATLIDGRIIGGYSPISWGTNNGQWINNLEIFLFDDDYKYTSNASPWGFGQYALYQSSSYFPAFGGGFDFLINDDGTKTLTTNAMTFSYNQASLLGVSFFPNQSYHTYQLKDLEVYSIAL